MPGTALITGITGQDGAYLAQLLLEKKYRVYGAFRRVSTVDFWRIKELGIDEHPNLRLMELDLTDQGNCLSVIKACEPDEVYNLAAQSFVKLSFDQPHTTAQITALGVLNILEAIRLVNPKIRFYQASTSEMFGKVHAVPQDEETVFHPRSPYGVAKLYAHWITLNYRESYDIFGCSGILFNHESPLRGEEFVTRKITSSIARIKLGLQDTLELGNLDARRDWGFAGEYVEGMWRMLQTDEPDTYVLATGKTKTIRDFLKLAFQYAEMDVEFSGSEQEEIVTDTKTNKVIMRINPRYYRPAEVDLLIGNPKKAKEKLGWETKTTLDELCKIMFEFDFEKAKQESWRK
uniref:GDP-mannose 4,6-dehydratase n=1 Tax=Candidatus Kentrum sp. LPFa TaxID=2126335 RepID=A0A450Y0Q9_9GAMM|nr:MAG: GDPmannose 4,6-dehydratase [Candidatus Kentron sp. LPFa]VFK35137.1 MAG: GDPmannose 4,6-dehydratase [Candidatus Kentron sp. LPFa]